MATRTVFPIDSLERVLNAIAVSAKGKSGVPLPPGSFDGDIVSALTLIAHALVSIAYDVRYLADARFNGEERIGYVGPREIAPLDNIQENNQ